LLVALVHAANPSNAVIASDMFRFIRPSKLDSIEYRPPASARMVWPFSSVTIGAAELRTEISADAIRRQVRGGYESINQARRT
jgi:hypothetical protein